MMVLGQIFSVPQAIYEAVLGGRIVAGDGNGILRSMIEILLEAIKVS